MARAASLPDEGDGAVAGAPLAFSSARSLAPMMGVFVALASIELCVVHLLVALLWSRWAAVALSLLSIATIVWIVGVIRSLRRLPTLIDGDRLVLRAGRLAGVTIARGEVASVRTSFTRDEVKRRSTLNLGLIAFPDVLVELRRPVRTRRGRMVDAVALKLDAPSGFVEDLSRAPAGPSP